MKSLLLVLFAMSIGTSAYAEKHHHDHDGDDKKICRIEPGEKEHSEKMTREACHHIMELARWKTPHHCECKDKDDDDGHHH